MGHLLSIVAEAAAETLWPTRCALCDAPGDVVCARCARDLPFIDWWRACRVCGSPYGLVQCDLCNPVALARMGLERLPFKGCASAVLFTHEAGRIVRVFKDQGEQRIALAMAQVMVRMLSPAWRFDAVTFVPATASAVRQRGFDHAELLALELSRLAGVTCEPTLERPRTRDQRGLSASQRIDNLAGSFSLGPSSLSHERYLIVDDVFTTGSTLCAAAQALLASGARTTYGLTFARV